MADYTTISIYVFVASLVAYIILAVRNSSEKSKDSAKLSLLDKIAQYMSASGSLEKALRQIVQERPASTFEYSKIIRKLDGGAAIGDAIVQASAELEDKLYNEIFSILICVNRKNDAKMLYDSVQKIKEEADLQNFVNSKSEIGSFIVQFVFALIIPLIFFFMLSTLGIQADVYLNGFLGIVVISTAIFQGVVFRQWPQALIKIPMLGSVFYILYFVVAPTFLAGLLGSIV